jgi:hypothetical protein
MTTNTKNKTETVIVDVAYTARGWAISFEERQLSSSDLIMSRQKWEVIVPRNDHKRLVQCLHGIYAR